MQQSWTRRHFLQAAGLTVAAQAAYSAAALPLVPTATHAYVAVDDHATRSGIEVFRIVDGRWNLIQFIEAVAPSAIALHARTGTLFVANALTSFQGLPTASVQSFRIDLQHRTLTRCSQQKLALASVMPHALALSPDGSLLVVAAAAGLYNLLPIAKDGTIAEVTAVRKELRLHTDNVSHMHFISDDRLQVHDAEGSRLYHCHRDGMHLLKAPAPLPSMQHLEASPEVVPAQRAVAFFA